MEKNQASLGEKIDVPQTLINPQNIYKRMLDNKDFRLAFTNLVCSLIPFPSPMPLIPQEPGLCWSWTLAAEELFQIKAF